MSGVEELAGLLTEERRLLEYLLFKLVAARQLLSAGETRFLGWSAAEVERAVRRVRDTEAVRASMVATLARDFDLGSERATLRGIAARAGGPMQSILDDHRLAMHELLGEISQVQSANRAMASDGVRLVEDVVELIGSGLREASDG
jgi:hypothetical protein